MVLSPLDALHRLQSMEAAGVLDRLCGEFEVDLLVAFGSATDPVGAPDARDLDVAVRFRSPSRARLLDFTAGLERLLDGTPVDVMDLRRAGVIGRFKALGAGTPLYESAAGLWAMRQAAAVLEYMDTTELRRLDRQLLKESA